MSNGSPSSYSKEYSQLIEDTIFLIRQSCYVQLARVDAFLDGAVLAAEQVQDIRIKFLETPEEITGWEFLGNILLTFALEGTIGGKLLASVTKKIFTPIFKQNAVFMLLPKSPYGVELKRQAQRLARMNAPPPVRISGGPGMPSIPLFRTSREAPTVTISAVLQKGAGGPGLEALGRENVQLYHASLEAIVRGTDKAQTNLTAAAKATLEVNKKRGSTPTSYLGATDSIGVAILSAAKHYASLTRLGIQLRHARVEQIVRGQLLMPDDLTNIADLFDWEDLELDINGQRISCNLSDIRDRYKMLFEAIIWARLYGFDQEKGKPGLDKDKFENIDKKFSDYWRNRFSANIEAWNEMRSKFYQFSGKFSNLSDLEQLQNLRNYFWDIYKELPRI